MVRYNTGAGFQYSIRDAYCALRRGRAPPRRTFNTLLEMQAGKVQEMVQEIEKELSILY